MRLEGIRKVYEGGPPHVAVHDVDLEIADGEFVVLVGPSGSGKSTILRMIAGLETISAGTLVIGDRRVNDLAPRDRDIAMVFQSYALYPHMTVFRNMAFALELRRVPRDEVERRVRAAAAMFGLEDVLDRHPRQLSGGQRQRVAVGRAIVRQPEVFLFDEPLSNLDAALRVQLRREIAALHRRLGATMVYVTHDQVEAMTLGERIVVLKDGRVQQVEAPLALYERPANRFVGQFIGSPAMNIIEATVESDGEPRLRSVDDSLVCPVPSQWLDAVASADGRRLLLGIRPEDVRLASPGVARMRIDAVESMGNETILHGVVGPAVRLTARAGPRDLPAAGSEHGIELEPSRVHLFDGETQERLIESSR